MSRQLHLVEAPSWGPAAASLLGRHRRVRWRFELLDSRSRVLRDLGGVADFSAEFNLHATVRGGGSLVYVGPEVDWTRHRIRAWYGLESRGDLMEWPVGTFIVEAPERTYTDAALQSLELDLYDVTLRLEAQTTTAGEWVARAGENPVEVARRLLDRAKITHSLEDTDRTLRSAMTWPAGTKYGRVVNDLMDAAGHFAAYADPLGVVRSGPHRAPAYRGTAHTFRDDLDGLPYAPETRHRADYYSVPSEVVLIAESDDPDAVPLVARARSAPDSPFSYEVRGMTRTHVEDNVATTSAQALAERAARRLEELQRVASTIEFQALPVPVALNDVVEFHRGRHGVAARAVVEKYSYGLGAGELQSLTVREVQG